MGNCVTCITPDTKTHHNNTNSNTSNKKTKKANPYSTSPAVIRVLKDLSPGGSRWTRVTDKYTLGHELGRGEFGITHLCTDRETREKLACKSISKKKLRTAIDVEDVRREVAIMSSLPMHSNIVKLRATYEDGEAVHLVMELCEGGELFDRIVARGHYSERAAAAVAKTVAEVVKMCHDNGVIHRDLKPENFLFANKKETSPLKAIDFGLSVFFKPGEKFSEIVGSPYYMAPEVLRRNYGPEVDVWSAGVILYILLCGVPPFWAETEQGVALAILRGVLDFKREPWPQISETAKSLVRKMLEPDPRKRLTAKQVLGKKMQLPFGGNPFAKPATANPTSVAGQSRPQNIVPTILTAPPPPIKEKDKGKRGINDVPKGTSKRSKFGTTEGDPPLQLISATFGSLAANHYSDDDAKLFMKRNSNDAEFAFKMGLGEAFYHGLNVLTEKNDIIQDQEKGLKKLKGEASSLKDQLSNVQKQLDKESKARKDEVGKLQDECTRLAADAKQAGEASKKEKEEMQFKLDELNKKMEKELSDAYSLGFLGYLKNFLAADPDYDWSVHFAPSTSHYISTFKAENAKSIEEARKELLQKIESELKTKAEEEARKQTTGGDAEADNISGASPSNTTAS